MSTHDHERDRDKATKLTRLLLDPAAADGEILNAARALQRMVADSPQGDSVSALRLLLGEPVLARLPDALFPFGKHKGQALSFVAALDPDYLLWFIANVRPRGKRLRQAIAFWLQQAQAA